MNAINKVLVPILLVTFLASAQSHVFGDAPTQIPKTVILNDKQGEYPLGLYLEILEDPTAKLTVDQVASAENNRKFVPSRVEVPNFGFTRSAYWVRFQVRNEAGQTRKWLLEVGFANMHYMACYLPRSDRTGWEVKRAGALLPFDKREVANVTHVFQLPLKPGAEETIYLRFETGTSMTLPLTLWSLETFARESRTDGFIAGLWYGTLLIMLGYNVFLLFSLREKAYLYYVLFVASFLLFNSSYDGTANQYIWSSPIWSRFGVLLFFGASTVSGLKFTSTFLQTKVHIPKLHRVIVVCLVVWGLSIVQIPFVGYSFVIRTMTALVVPSALVMLIAGLMTWRLGGCRATLYNWRTA